MKITLSKFETLTAKTIELEDAMSTLGMTEEGALKAITGSRKGAEFALAKNISMPHHITLYTPNNGQVGMPQLLPYHTLRALSSQGGYHVAHIAVDHLFHQ